MEVFDREKFLDPIRIQMAHEIINTIYPEDGLQSTLDELNKMVKVLEVILKIDKEYSAENAVYAIHFAKSYAANIKDWTT